MVRSKRGVVEYLAILVLIVLGTLAVAFHRLARHAQAMAFRFEISETVRQTSESAIDEAFMRLLNGTAKAEVSPEMFSWFLDRRNSDLSIPVPMTEEQAKLAIIRSDFEPVIKASARHIDFRGEDSRGNRYFSREGVGTIELTVSTSLRRNGKASPIACTISRHHDFKIVSVVSPADNSSARDSYVQNFLLDYALFVRKGLAEFRRDSGTSLNNASVRITLDQDGLPAPNRGKVFIGGTTNPEGPSSGAPNESPKGNYAFLNVNEKFQAMIPRFPQKEILRINLDECLKLFPELAPSREAIQGMEGVFLAQFEPLVKDPSKYVQGELSGQELRAKNALLTSLSGAEANLDPGLELLSREPTFAATPENAKGIFEGALRQRFMYFVHFYLDASKVSGVVPQAIEDLKNPGKHLVCVPMPNPPPPEERTRSFLSGLQQLEAKRTPGQPSLLSRFSSDFLFQGGQDGGTTPINACFQKPRFFQLQGELSDITVTGKDGFRPFRHVNLWARRLNAPQELEKFGYIDKARNRLNLRGIVTVNGYVELGEAGGQPLEICGQGVIIADGFRILSGLRKIAPNDIAVLYARSGMIEINTREEIEASLFAINDSLNGMVKPLVPVKLKGSLAVDLLDTNRWSRAGESLLRYDPVLKRTDPIFQINISRWVTFTRVTETDESGSVSGDTP